MMQPLNLSPSPESWDNVVTAKLDGQLYPSTGRLYPLILMRFSRSLYTSVFVPLEKAAR